MSKHCSLQETAALLQAANKIVLCSHVSPDGDTLGSALSLMKALQKLGKDVIVTVDDEISKVYKFLPGIESFIRFQNDEQIAADLLVVINRPSFWIEPVTCHSALALLKCSTSTIIFLIPNMPIICILIQLRPLPEKLCMR